MNPSKNLCCNVCGNFKSDFLFYGKDRLHGFDGQFKYVRCTECGLVYMNPQIDSEKIPDFYPEDYAPHKSGIQVLKNKKHPPISLPNCILERINAASKVLDVGCGNGQFLFNIQNRAGCRVEGIDMSENAVKASEETYGLKIFKGNIFDAPFPKNYFDLITAFSYIEHIPDPNRVIKHISELLKPNGMFLIKTPNIDSWPGRLFRDKWYNLDCPRHLFLFSPETLTTLIEHNGLHTEKILYDKSSKGWSASLQYCLYGNNYRLKSRNKIKHSRLIRFFTSPLARLAYLFHESDIITVYGFKKARGLNAHSTNGNHLLKQA